MIFNHPMERGKLARETATYKLRRRTGRWVGLGYMHTVDDDALECNL